MIGLANFILLLCSILILSNAGGLMLAEFYGTYLLLKVYMYLSPRTKSQKMNAPVFLVYAFLIVEAAFNVIMGMLIPYGPAKVAAVLIVIVSLVVIAMVPKFTKGDKVIVE